MSAEHSEAERKEDFPVDPELNTTESNVSIEEKKEDSKRSKPERETRPAVPVPPPNFPAPYDYYPTYPHPSQHHPYSSAPPYPSAPPHGFTHPSSSQPFVPPSYPMSSQYPSSHQQPYPYQTFSHIPNPNPSFYSENARRNVRKKKYWLFFAAGMFLLLVGMFFVFGLGEKLQTTNLKEEPLTENSMAEDGNSGDHILPGSSSQSSEDIQTFYGLGETANIDGIHVSVTSAKLVSSSEKDIAVNGQFLLLEFDITNKSDETKVYDLSQMNVIDDQGRSYSIGNHSELSSPISEELAKDETINVVLAFDVTESDFYTIDYNEGNTQWVLSSEQLLQ